MAVVTVLLAGLVSFTTSPAAAAPTGPAAAAPCYPDEDPYACQYLELYSSQEFSGTLEQIPTQADGTCADLAKPVTRASSLRNRQDLAVLFYDATGCTGTSYRVGSYSYLRDLTPTGFTRAVSVKFVTDVCSSKQRFVVCLHKDIESAGVFQAYPKQTVNACVQLPAALKGQVTSIMNNLQDDATRRQDVLLFATDNCTGAAHRQNAWTGHPDLADVDFDNKARSVKFVVDPCVGQVICLWNDVLYDGPAQVIGFQATNTCITLNTAVRGQVSSLRQNLYYPDQDVLLYTGDGCTGTSKRIDAGTAHSQLSDIAFDNKARSVKFLQQDA
ncbi:hypothetical protein [Actinoplanes friuliensis]|uniref:hypothetical protein n=1 Tax=Actinoplanes friuliensis TaxID=196914 RepID=UPI0003FD4943|nr:hypothetical protein [Actinoplanes friuliensis]